MSSCESGAKHAVKQAKAEHLTDRMKDHHSTVGEEEQREGIGRVLSRARVEGVQLVTREQSPTDARALSVSEPATAFPGGVPNQGDQE